MRALTINQPYASWVLGLYGTEPRKRFENRLWSTRYRGPLLIHSGKSLSWLTGAADEALPRGVVLGRVDLVDCLEPEQCGGDPHAEGPWCFVLDNPRPLPEPIPWRGKLSLWEFPEEQLPPEFRP